MLRTWWPSSVTESGTFSSGSPSVSLISAISPGAIFSINRRVLTNVMGQTSSVMSRKWLMISFTLIYMAFFRGFIAGGKD